MPSSLFRTLLKWAVCLALLGGLIVGLVLANRAMQAERAREEGEEKVESPVRMKDGAVVLDEDDVERYDLATQPAQTTQWEERVAVLGRVIPNTQAEAEARSPFPGTVRAAPGSSWPAAGQHVRAGQTIGWVDVRVGPEVRLDLQNKLSEARIRQEGAEKEVALQQDRAASLESVTAQKLIARPELDAARIALAQAKNQQATARAAAELWQKALREVDRHKDSASSWSQPLLAPADGTVTELLARPGATVEAGTALLRLVDFRRPLIRLDVPVQLLAQGEPQKQLEVEALAAQVPSGDRVLNEYAWGAPPRFATLTVQRIGPAPQLDPTAQRVGYWYEASLKDRKGSEKAEGAALALWRPGLQVRAWMQAAGAQPRPAVAVPAGAVLYHEGRALVYVEVEPRTYRRREVRLLGRRGNQWVLSPAAGLTGVKAGEAVVSRQAQVLLSEEFRGKADQD